MRPFILSMLQWIAACGAASAPRSATVEQGGVDPLAYVPANARSVVWVELQALRQLSIARLIEEDWEDLEPVLVDLLTASGEEQRDDRLGSMRFLKATANADWLLFVDTPGEHDRGSHPVVLLRGSLSPEDVVGALRGMHRPPELPSNPLLGLGASIREPQESAPSEVRRVRVGAHELITLDRLAATELEPGLWMIGHEQPVRLATTRRPAGSLPPVLADLWAEVDRGALIAAVGLAPSTWRSVTEYPVADTASAEGSTQAATLEEMVRAGESDGAPHGEAPEEDVEPAGFDSSWLRDVAAWALRLREIEGSLAVELFLDGSSDTAAIRLHEMLAQMTSREDVDLASRVAGVHRVLASMQLEQLGGRVQASLRISEERLVSLWGRAMGVAAVGVYLVKMFMGLRDAFAGMGTPEVEPAEVHRESLRFHMEVIEQSCQQDPSGHGITVLHPAAQSMRAAVCALDPQVFYSFGVACDDAMSYPCSSGSPLDGTVYWQVVEQLGLDAAQCYLYVTDGGTEVVYCPDADPEPIVAFQP